MLQSIMSVVAPGRWLASLDLKDAYFHVPIFLSHRKFLRVNWRGQTFQFRLCLSVCSQRCGCPLRCWFRSLHISESRRSRSSSTWTTSSWETVVGRWSGPLRSLSRLDSGKVFYQSEQVRPHSVQDLVCIGVYKLLPLLGVSYFRFVYLLVKIYTKSYIP